MADIHVLESNFRGDSGTLRLIFHVPNDTNQNNYPGGVVSILSGLNQIEIDGLFNGTLYEEESSIRFHKNSPLSTVRSRIRKMWQPKADKVQAKLNKNYKFYGIELTKV